MDYEQASSYATGNGERLDSYPMPMQNVATKRLCLDSAQAELRQSIEEVAKRVQDLEARLGLILTPDQPSANSNKDSAPQPPRSQMLDSVISAKRAVQMILRHVESLINRIEL